MARWPPGSSSCAANVIGPGAWTFTVRVPPRKPGPLPGLFERVDVLVEQAGRAPGHRAAARRDPIAAGHRVDADVDQQRAGAADDIRSDAAGR